MKIHLAALAAGLATLLSGCGNDPGVTPTITPTPDPDPEPAVELGDPRPDLTAEELAAFERGRKIFEKHFKPSEGLGPLYNATSCMSCHSSPVAGGSSKLYRNFYVAKYGDGPFFNLPGLPSVVVPAFGSVYSTQFTLERGRTPMPDSIGIFPVQSDQRNGIPIFGVGQFEFVTDETILALSDPEDEDGDGISGRHNRDGAGIGRFGTKAQSNNIEVFTRAPLFNQMGISTNPFDGEAGNVSLGHGVLMQGSATPNAPTNDFDGVPDPELAHEDLGDLIAFSRFLAAPQPKEFNASASRGEVLFDQVGCTACHMPELPSSRGPVRAYTDLLLHNMGPDLSGEVSFGTPQVSSIDGATTEAEWRTAPLWGISSASPYLHDGRAPTLAEAIGWHGGEGQAARERYEGLSADEREDILEFLRHL